MKIALPSLTLVLLACSTSSPDTSASGKPGTSDTTAAPSTSTASLGSSAEALRKLTQVDANDVQQCRDAAARCNAGGDAASNPFCGRVSQHCDDLEAQLAADRAELEQCLADAAACEASAADPADCAAARAACEPADGNFRARRGRTLECAGRAERCFDGGGFGGRFGFGGFGRRDADAADAGTCDDDTTDFVGCCQGHHARGGDAGVPAFGQGRGGPGGFPGPGLRPDRNDDRDDDIADAGARRPRPGAPLRRAP